MGRGAGCEGFRCAAFSGCPGRGRVQVQLEGEIYRVKVCFEGEKIGQKSPYKVAKAGEHTPLRLDILEIQTSKGECGDVFSAWNYPFSGCWFAPNSRWSGKMR
jgi:hypothetical protein